MRAKDLEGDPAKPVTTAIGSGPFRFNHAEHVSGALTVFERGATGVLWPDALRARIHLLPAAGICSRAPQALQCTIL
jgi:hypothetical protein